MIVTVLWEDQRGVETKGFGPHDLLLACLSDELGKPMWELARTIKGNPKKGNGGVVRALKQSRLAQDGPVIAVLDRDRAVDLWKNHASPPGNCMSSIRRRIEKETAIKHELVFLVQNVESLIEATCLSLGHPIPEKKPAPNERDLLLKPAIAASRDKRDDLRKRCESFDRLVRKVVAETQTWEARH